MSGMAQARAHALAKAWTVLLIVFCVGVVTVIGAYTVRNALKQAGADTAVWTVIFAASSVLLSFHVQRLVLRLRRQCAASPSSRPKEGPADPARH